MSRFFLVFALSVIAAQAMSQEDLPLITAPRVIMETPYGGAVFVYKYCSKIVDGEGLPVSVEKATLHLIGPDQKSEVAFLDMGVLGLKKINVRNGQVTVSGTKQGLPPGTNGTIYRVERSIEYTKQMATTTRSSGEVRTGRISLSSALSRPSTFSSRFSTRSYGFGIGLRETSVRSSSMNAQSRDYSNQKSWNNCPQYEGLFSYGYQSGSDSNIVETTSLLGSYDTLFPEVSKEEFKPSK